MNSGTIHYYQEGDVIMFDWVHSTFWGILQLLQLFFKNIFLGGRGADKIKQKVGRKCE
jgi:hypothetical protein